MKRTNVIFFSNTLHEKGSFSEFQKSEMRDFVRTVINVGKLQTSDSSGTVVRIESDVRCFVSDVPYDTRCNETKTGTGFLLRVPKDKRVVLATAHHVVSNAIRVMCTFDEDPSGEAKELFVIGVNPNLDVAFLMGKDPAWMMKYPAFEVGNSNTLMPQTSIVAMGFPHGDRYMHTTTGTISGRSDWPHNRLQTDTAINPGNSGGPVLQAKTKKVIGIVTSGLNFAQATNYFTGINETMLVYERTKLRRVDLGYDISAVMRPVGRWACGGKRGGALVVAAHKESGVKEGDVILKIQDSTKTLKDVDSHMRITDKNVWKSNKVDFRTSFGMLNGSNDDVRNLSAVVRRGNDEVNVVVKVGPSMIATRERNVDCEPTSYVNVGGVVVQMLNYSLKYKVRGVHDRMFRDPQVVLHSVPVITHVESGSPFSVHGEAPLVGSILVRMRWSDATDKTNKTKENIKRYDDSWVEVKTLEDLAKALNSSEPGKSVQLETDLGFRVGCSKEDLLRYEKANAADAALARGIHTVTRELPWAPSEPPVSASQQAPDTPNVDAGETTASIEGLAKEIVSDKKEDVDEDLANAIATRMLEDDDAANKVERLRSGTDEEKERVLRELTDVDADPFISHGGL